MTNKNFFDDVGPADMATARRIFEQKGRIAILREKGAHHIFTEAEKLDIQRKGFLQALADLCLMGMETGIPKKTIVECLNGAVEGMDHV